VDSWTRSSSRPARHQPNPRGSVLGLTLSISRKLVEKTEQDSNGCWSRVRQAVALVWLDKDGVEVETPLEKLRVGDVIIVHTVNPRRRRRVVDGDGGSDALTGESAPVEKIKATVLAATTLIAGKIESR